MNTNTGHRYISHEISTDQYLVQIPLPPFSTTCNTLAEALIAREEYVCHELASSAGNVVDCHAQGNLKGLRVHAADVMFLRQRLAEFDEEMEPNLGDT